MFSLRSSFFFFWNCFRNLLQSFFGCFCVFSVALYFPLNEELFFSPYWHSNPAKKYASWDNAASLLWKPYFILSLQSERGKHKGAGIIECKGLQQTSPLSSVAGTPFLYFPLYSFCLPLLKGSCWVWAALPKFGLNLNFWKWYSWVSTG